MDAIATKYCLAATVTPTARGVDALNCLRSSIAEAQRLTHLEDLRADRGLMELVDAEGTVIGTAPAPIAWSPTTAPAFRGAVFAEAFAGDDPLQRHVRTTVRSPQTNGEVERFFGTLKYEHLYRAIITDGDSLAVEVAPVPADLQHPAPTPSPRRPDPTPGPPRPARRDTLTTPSPQPRDVRSCR